MVRNPLSNALASPIKVSRGLRSTGKAIRAGCEVAVMDFQTVFETIQASNCAVPGYDMFYSDNLGAEQTGRCFVVSKLHSVLWQEIQFSLNDMAQSSVSFKCP